MKNPTFDKISNSTSIHSQILDEKFLTKSSIKRICGGEDAKQGDFIQHEVSQALPEGMKSQKLGQHRNLQIK